MAKSSSSSLAPHPLDKTDQLLEEIYSGYTRISSYVKTVGKQKQSLRLPVPHDEFWEQCEKSYKKLLEQASSIDPNKEDYDLQFGLKKIKNFILLNEIDGNFKRYIVPCQERIMLVKKEISRLKGGLEQLTLPGVDVKPAQANSVKDKLVKIGKSIFLIAHLLECAITWSIKAELRTNRCNLWTFLEPDREPDPYHLSILEVEEQQLSSMVIEASKIAERCNRSKVFLDEELVSNFHVLGTAIESSGIAECQVFKSDALAEPTIPTDDMKEVLDDPWFLLGSGSVSDQEDELPIIDPEMELPLYLRLQEWQKKVQEL